MNNLTDKLIYEEGPEEAAKIIKGCFPAKVTVMFAPQNYLYTDCGELLTRMYNIMVVEQIEKSIINRPMFFSGYICGYSGEGPAKTEELLLQFGLDHTKAEELSSCYNGFQISFDKKGKLIDSDTIKGFPIEIRSKHHINDGKTFYVDTDMLVADYVERNLFFLDITEPSDFISFLNTVSSIEPESFDYYIGSDNEKEVALPYIPLELERRERDRPGYIRNKLDGSFILFHGKSFDVTAFINEDIAISTINILSSLFAGYELFEEKRIGRYGAFFKEKYKHSKKGLSGRVHISNNFIS